MYNKDVVPKPPNMDKWDFINELRQYTPPRFYWNNKRQANKDELDLSVGVEYCSGCVDQCKLLATVENDLERFLQQAGIYKHSGIPIYTKLIKSNELVNDSFLITVADKSIELSASNIEGIRRAIYYLEDLLLQAPGPFLKKGVIKRIAWLKNRISRCFFGPIKRAPYNHDELLDDIDYYPDEYLNKLAHEGVNGLWLTIVFSDLCKTSITKLHPDAQKRLAKLQKTVDKCLRYGIQTWVLSIEPASFLPDDPLLKDNPELRGALSEGKDRYCFCPSSEKAQKYLYESTNWLFEQVPGLGGMINISHGERTTTCLSSVSGFIDAKVECPHCKAIHKGEILSRSLGAMQKGMLDANLDAELICWLYMPTPIKRAEWVFEIASHLPKGVILQYNFESNGMKTQLGKPRIGGDYWLSYTGPSDDFIRLADKAKAAGVEMSAKIQVGCSHEVATIPFVPVPGLLYQKYKKMHEHGCSTVMQCWYFGNYPGIMNKAAGALAYENFERTEKDFLHEIACSEWGKYTETVVKAWEKLADGYSNYPLSNEFQYYGPIHDGVVWPLYLKPTLKPLMPTWKPELPPSGDAIGECLKGFTLSEVLYLCEIMDESWQKGVKMFTNLRNHFQNNPERLKDISLVEALGIQIKSGKNILHFYYLRHRLLTGKMKEASSILSAMKFITEEEIRNAERLIELCESDSRLGFHSEAENYKYYPDKLNWRINQLKELLNSDFPEFQGLLQRGEALPAVPAGRQVYSCGDGWIYANNFSWRIDKHNEDFIVLAKCDSLSSILIVSFIDQAGILFPQSFLCSSDASIYNFGGVWGKVETKISSENKWNLKITVPALSWDMGMSKKPAYFSFIYVDPESDNEVKHEIWPQPKVTVQDRLAFGYYSPENMAFLID